MIRALFVRFFGSRLATARLRLKAELKSELKTELKSELESELKSQLMRMIESEYHAAISKELTKQFEVKFVAGMSTYFKTELALTLDSVRRHQRDFDSLVDPACSPILSQLREAVDVSKRPELLAALRVQLRRQVRLAAGLPADPVDPSSMEDLLVEVSFLRRHESALRPVFVALQDKRVLFSGQAYYNAWYLSRELRRLDWRADVLNWDTNAASQIYYHGEDFRVGSAGLDSPAACLAFYVDALYDYDVFHFSNAHAICFGFALQEVFRLRFGMHAEIMLLKGLGKKIVYSHNGCLDGVSQTAFSKWGPASVCSICRWRNEPSVCSDERNLEWGKFRNAVADYQCLSGGNRIDYNDDPRVHEAPWFYCLDPAIWDPSLPVPEAFRLPTSAVHVVRLYHAIGNRDDRTNEAGVNIKSSHVYLPLVRKLKAEGLALELMEPTGIPNIDVRFLQMQADIFLDMLTFGWFGANAREAMMLAKPVICFLRPEWLESVRKELPGYVEELPVVSATPATVEMVLRRLIENPAECREIGERGRRFAIKWHSASAGARQFDAIYSRLLGVDPVLRVSSMTQCHAG